MLTESTEEPTPQGTNSTGKGFKFDNSIYQIVNVEHLEKNIDDKV
jgi:hypothetical protein